MSLIIAGERSGAGKTTITLALLAALKSRGVPVQSFKVGPDYIDPMFHHYVTGRPCRNLDPILTSEDYVRKCFAKYTQDCQKPPQYALVEGVMGLFDGVKTAHQPDKNDYASTAHIARILDLPVIFVIDCSRLSGSVAAIAHGYCTLDSRIKMAGVVLNRVGSDRHLELLKDALEGLNLPVLGVLRRTDEISIPDRHLGLVPSEELGDLDAVIERLAEIGNECFDWGSLLPLLEIKTADVGQARCLPHQWGGQHERHSTFKGLDLIKIAVARDKAFNFYYQDNLDMLEELGAELVFWSPLEEKMPVDVEGLYFGGGFPEVFAEKLSENKRGLEAVREAILGGMPVYAECGGLMYLCEEIIDFEGKNWRGVGVIPASAVMGKRLTLGYRQCVALQDSPLLAKDQVVWGHEFHRSSLTLCYEGEEKTPARLFEIRGISAQSTSELEGWGMPNLHASYVHLHWGATTELPARFLESCVKFKQQK
ncbi:cobyrinate a,c-diamide synthase [Ancylothrix sp. C2]|uniref:cobyrinate a,c-diamide synthase n=1 Tax=Ancylothrix sp. D3o TaxID=2953691 RepID=UPI0021BBB476|nr:cobyrinate a,c-diamide synthase [Ancylothrix sp. D3o]MCT7950459.1 cobyrinate a,c-diamide synthase [Ancylothrix sp. D3o]